jgi:carboxypeptidase PM20D1
MLSTILIFLVAFIFLLAAFVLVRMLLFTRQSGITYLPHESHLPELEVDAMAVAKNLSSVIKTETISHEDTAEDIKANFKVMQSQLAKQYPLTHSQLKKEIIDGFSLLYTWKGSNETLDPVVLMAHQDVVPADEHTLSEWTHTPFSGDIADGFIWGRGTMDIKNQLIAVFEAVEQLLRNNFQPERTVLLSFSHNEEVLGSGAKAVVAHLKAKGVRVQSVIDEGGSIYNGMLPGVKGLSAMIGVSEKGYLSLKLQAQASGGHSSTPTSSTAIGILARAIDRLQNNLFPARVSAVLPMFKGLGTAASPLMQLAFSNLWLFSGLIKAQLAARPEADATIRTTTAPTIIKGGVKDNVLPSVAEAVVNFRLLPGETIANACEHVRKVIKDERVTFEPMPEKAWEASPVSPVNSKAYQHLASVTNELFPGAAIAPYIMLGGTDSRNFCEVSDQVYRFSPIIVTREDVHRVHGVNERLSIESMHKMVGYFYRLIPRWASTEM